MLMRQRFAAVAWLVLLSALPAAAQHQIPAGAETIDVSIVNLDVFVTDKQGNRVHGLTRDDFEVRENRAIQTITNFAEYTPEQTSGGSAAGLHREGAPSEPAAPWARRTIVIFVDVVRQPAAIKQVFASLRQFVRHVVRPGDAVAVVSYHRDAKMLQSYTDDSQALESALTTLERESFGLSAEAAADPQRARLADAEDAAGGAAAAGQAPAQTDVAASSNAETARGAGAPRLDTEGLDRAAESFLGAAEMRRKTAAITSVLRSMSAYEGKKLMIVALQGFGGRSIDTSMGVAIYSKNQKTEVLRQAVVRAANANGVTLYPINLVGVRSEGVTSLEVRRDLLSRNPNQQLLQTGDFNARLLNEITSLGEIATQTGGLSAVGASQVANLLPRISEDLESYYSLAYRVPGPGDDRRRTITVTAKNRSYRVRSRRSAIGKSDDERMHDRVIANLFQPAEQSMIALRVELGAPARKSRSVYTIPLVVRIPVAGLTARAQGGALSGSFSLFISSGGASGVLLNAVQQRTYPYSITPNDPARSNDGYLTFDGAVEVDPSADRISVGVRDDVSKEYGLVRIALPPLSREKQGD